MAMRETSQAINQLMTLSRCQRRRGSARLPGRSDGQIDVSATHTGAVGAQRQTQPRPQPQLGGGRADGPLRFHQSAAVQRRLPAGRQRIPVQEQRGGRRRGGGQRGHAQRQPQRGRRQSQRFRQDAAPPRRSGGQEPADGRRAPPREPAAPAPAPAPAAPSPPPPPRHAADGPQQRLSALATVARFESPQHALR